MKSAFSLPKKPAFLPGVELHLHGEVLVRATIAPASATSISPGASVSCRSENDGSSLIICCTWVTPCVETGGRR